MIRAFSRRFASFFFTLISSSVRPVKSSTSGSGSGSGTYAGRDTLAPDDGVFFRDLDEGGGMSFPGVLRMRLRSSHCSTYKEYSPKGTHMWPFGPFCAMFGVSKISIRSRWLCAGFVGGHASGAAAALIGAAGSGSRPAVLGSGAGGSGSSPAVAGSAAAGATAGAAGATSAGGARGVSVSAMSETRGNERKGVVPVGRRSRRSTAPSFVERRSAFRVASIA
mmetsp:Transcript_9635/g.40891  ORF Transcript_9635/g.40891 Transcript_9635/m.40891 type:complete len:222 (-) Transcript_9635:188-853(-)